MPVVNFGEIDPNNYEDKPYMDGYTFEELIKLYLTGIPIKEGDEKILCYMDNVNQNYWYKTDIKNIGISKELKISNFGKIYLNDKEQPNVNGIIDIKNKKFKIYRLVAEVFCENKCCDIYTHVHHIGNDKYNNSKNLIFLTQFQHDNLHSTIKQLKQDYNDNNNLILELMSNNELRY